jgi:hypothetical protein
MQPRRPDTATQPHLRQHSLGDTILASGLPGAVPRRGCAAGLTADECMHVDSAITALQKHPDPQCRAVGDSAHARLYRGHFEFIQPTLSGMGYRRRIDGPVVVAQPGVTWVGAEQFDWRGRLMEVIARELTPDSLTRNSVAATCRRLGG